MGAFITFVSTAIMFYYSVVAGWCIYYFISAVKGDLFATANHLQFWNDFSSSFLTILFHLFSITIGSFIVFRGIVKGVEKANRFLVSALLIILILIFLRAVTLPNAFEGLKYFFTPQLDIYFDYKVWLNALNADAWDPVLAGGLIMTLRNLYEKKKRRYFVKCCT
jgi:NSS family neurotransmitter:Na+ symporter